MSRPTRMTTTFFLAIILFAGFIPAAYAVEDAIIAVVNDELITLKDLRDYAHSTMARMAADGASERQIQSVMDEMDKNGINKLIEDKLILSRSNELELEVREEMVDEKIHELEKKYGSQQNLINALIQTGATLTDLRNKIRDELKIQFIVDHEVKRKIYVNPQEVTEYYDANADKFGRKERVNLNSIFIGYGKDKAATTQKANEALEQLKEGKNFKEVAKEYSESPSVGIVEKGQLLPEIEDVVFKLELDELSSLVETETGIYIFKLIGKTPAEIPPLEDVKEAVYDILYKEKFRTRFMGWLAKLKENAYIEIK